MRQSMPLVCLLLLCTSAAQAAGLDIVQSRLDARETFDPNAKLPRIDLDLLAEITPRSAIFNPGTIPVRVELPPPDASSPVPCFDIPVGCFVAEANDPQRFVVKDFIGCGGSFTLQPGPNSNDPPVDMTGSIRSFDAEFVVNAFWKLSLDVGFLDDRQSPHPCFIPAFGGAERLEVAIGADRGALAPAQSETKGGDALQGGELTLVRADTSVAESVDPNTQLPRFDVDFRTEIDAGASGVDPKTEAVQVQWDAAGIIMDIDLPIGCLRPRGTRYVVTDPQGCGVTVEVGEQGGNIPPDDVTANLLYFDAALKPQANGNFGFVGSLGLLDDAHPIHNVLAGAEEFRVVIGSDAGAATPQQVEARAP